MAGRLKKSKGKINATWRANLAKLGPSNSSSTLKDVRIEALDSMVDVRKYEKQCYDFQGIKGRRTDSHRWAQDHIVSGERDKADRAVERSDALIDEVIALEPRLAKRTQWMRSDDGIFADAGLVASGDDSPCYAMTRRSLREASHSLDPVKVVVSTDSNKPTDLTSFVAVVRIVQQFRPVHVWWQGAWLADDGREAGYVFHAPIVTGDMDFARLAYVVSDYTRDLASFGVMHSIAYERDRVNLLGLGRPADWSYMPDSKYVSQEGILANPHTIARVACDWLGIDSPYKRERQAEDDINSALQALPKPVKPYKDTRTDDEKERDRQWHIDYEERKKREAQDRITQNS